jgi:hypothetical protein
LPAGWQTCFAGPHLLNGGAVANCNDGAVAADGAQVGVCHDGPKVRLRALRHALLQLQPHEDKMETLSAFCKSVYKVVQDNIEAKSISTCFRRGCIATPVDQTQAPKGMVYSSFVRLQHAEQSME